MERALTEEQQKAQRKNTKIIETPEVQRVLKEIHDECRKEIEELKYIIDQMNKGSVE